MTKESDTNLEAETHKSPILKWIRRLVFTFVLFWVVVIVLLQFSTVQTWLTSKVTKYISEATNTTVVAERIKINPLNGIVLLNFNIIDQNADTIVHAGAFNVSLRKNLFYIFNNELDLSYLGIKDLKMRIITEEGDFKSNFQRFIDNLSTAPKSNQPSNPFDFNLKDIDLSQIDILIHDKNKGKYDKLTLASGTLDINYIDLICNDFDINSILLDQPAFTSHTYENDCSITDELEIPQKSQQGYEMTETGEATSITLRELVINNGKFGKSNALVMPDTQFSQYLDYSNFYFEKINVLIKDFTFRNNNELFAKLETLSARDNTGFEITNIKADSIVINKTKAELISYTINMGNTYIKDRLKFSFADFGAFKNFANEVIINAELNDSRLYLDDLVHFVRSLSKVSFVKNNGKEIIELNGRYFGKVNNLAGRDVDIRLGQKLSFAGSFSTRDLLDPDNTVLNIRLDKFTTSMRKIKMILPSFNPPDNFYKLGSINFAGRFDGYLEDFVAYGKLNTDIGSAEMDMRLDITEGTNKSNYSGTLNLKNFNLGTWSGNNDLGLVSFNSKVESGRGLTLNTVKADLKTTVLSIFFKKYEYKDFVLDGKIDKNTFEGIFKVEDKNLDFVFDGTLEYLDKQIFLNFKSDVKRIDLQALNLSQSPLAFKAKMDINLSGTNLNDFIGSIYVDDLDMTVKDSVYQLNSIDITSRNAVNGGKELKVVSDLGIIMLEGKYDLPNIVKSVKKVIYNNYPKLVKSWDPALLKEETNQRFDFNFDLIKSKNFLALAGLKNSEFKKLALKGRLDSYKNEFSIASEIPFLKIRNDSLNDLQLLVTSDSKSGDVLLHVDSTFAIGRHFNPIDLQTNLKGDTINFELTTVKLIDSLENLDIRGSLIPHPKGFSLTLADNLLVMLGTRWTIHERNNIIFGNDYFYLDNMILSDGFRSLEVNDINNNKGLSLDINNFNLNIVNGLISFEKMQFEGLTNISAKVQNVFSKESEISGYINVPEFKVNGEPYGTIYIDVNKTAANPVKANISIGDFLAIKGTYNEKTKEIDSRIKLRRAPMTLIEYLLKDGIKNTGGFINGDFTFTSKEGTNILDGQGLIEKGKTTLKYTGVTYYFDDQSFKLTNTAIDLNGARISDQNGNFGTITGGLVHNMFKGFGVNATISGDNVIGLNTTKADNPDYYGYGIGRLSAEFTGPFEKVDMKINAVTGPGTKLFIPVDNSQSALNQSFIKFVKKDDKNNDITTKKSYTLGGINIEMTMIITPDADISLIFNEAKGDIIKGKGRGNLKIDITRQGDFEIFGDYEIEQGEYLFTVALLPVAKPFVVERGGRIVWTGDPVNASLDITAKYRTRTSIEPFIAEYTTLANADGQRLSTQNTEVDLQLKLGGTLFKPEIRFNLSFPNLTGDVASYADSKLRLIQNNELELNGQVLGLIVFNTFLPSNRVSDMFGATGIQSASINTLSEFLSSQLSMYITNILNSMVKEGSFISGIDFDVNVRNNNFGLANNGLLPDEIGIRNTIIFKNDRLSLDIGGNYVVQRQGITNQVLPDFALEFILTDDRKLKVRLYGKYDIDLSTIGLREKYGLGVAYRTEFGSMYDFEKTIKTAVEQSVNKL